MKDGKSLIFSGPSLPLMIVDDVGACRDFWRDTLGFEVVVSEPEGLTPTFVVLRYESPEVSGSNGAVLIEYQSRSSLSPALQAAVPANGCSVVYLWLTAGLDAVRRRFDAIAPQSVLEFRTATYNADELSVRDPHGHVFIVGERHASANA